MLELSNVTLVTMTSTGIYSALKALLYSSRGIKFARVLFISHKKPLFLPGKVDFQSTSPIRGLDEYSYRTIFELPKYIDTEFAMLIHADGFVVNPASWRAEFLDYDYIGAPFALPKDDFSYRDAFGNIVRVGNGGVSLRSKRLMGLAVKLELPWEPFHGHFNEDGFICCKNRHVYENNGMKFAPLEVAKYFSHERMIPEIEGVRPFAFHKWDGSNRGYPKFNNLPLLFGGARG
jgi:hypothetical protein